MTLMPGIPSYLFTDFAPVSIHSRLHQFLLSYWIMWTNDPIILPPSYSPISLFLSKMGHKSVLYARDPIPPFPFSPLFAAIGPQPHLFTEMVLVKVSSNLHLAKLNKQVAVLMLLSLSAAGDTGDHTFLLESLSAACFHSMFPS